MTESNDERKRVTCKRPHPNPRLHDLLESLYQEAVAKSSRFVPAIEEAITSLAKYPLPLSSGSQCAILKGFNQNLCAYIDSQLDAPTGNKKTKVSKYVVYSGGQNVQANNHLHLNGCVQQSSHQNDNTCLKTSDLNLDMAATSKKNHKKSNNLVINTEKCLFTSNFGEASSTNTADVVMHSVPAVASTNSNKVKPVEQKNFSTLNDQKQSTSEKNNNSISNNKPVVLDNKLTDTLGNNIDNKRKRDEEELIRYDCCKDPTELLSQWDFLTNDDTPKIKTFSSPKEKSQINMYKDPKAIILSEWESVSKVGPELRNNDSPNQELINNDFEHPNVNFGQLESARNDDCLIFQNYCDAFNLKDYKLEQNLENDNIKDPSVGTQNQWESPLSNTECFKFQSDEDAEAISQCFQFGATPSICADDSTSKVETTSGSGKLLDGFDEEDAIYCKQCDNITTAADAFKSYYKDKMKKDAEEIGKCVLPRKLYKPAYRSGAYAILVALLEQRNECPYRASLTKEELILKAQKHTDESFTKPKLDSNYTAWTLSKRLISKGMIQVTNCDYRGEDVYMLTAMGRAIAMELVKENTAQVTVNDIIFHGQPNDRVPSVEDVILSPPPPLAPPDEEQSSEPVFIEMPPGTFEIVLLIDKREHYDPTRVHSYCKFELRSFTVGDFIWVARSKRTGQELVLPYVVERKRMDDLASSIRDGRFHEQKFRLRKCGLKNVLYLVENYGRNKHVVLPMNTLMQAIVNTSVQDDFMVVKTDSLEHTFKFLGTMSENLVHEFLPIFLRGCNRDTQGRELMTFEYFNKASSKNKPLTIKDTFVKMLLQLKGLSVEKALAITSKYNSPRALMKAYEKCSEKEGELLLANLKYNNFTRNVGPVVSKTIYQLFSRMEI